MAWKKILKSRHINGVFMSKHPHFFKKIIAKTV